MDDDDAGPLADLLDSSPVLGAMTDSTAPALGGGGRSSEAGLATPTPDELDALFLPIEQDQVAGGPRTTRSGPGPMAGAASAITPESVAAANPSSTSPSVDPEAGPPPPQAGDRCAGPEERGRPDPTVGEAGNSTVGEEPPVDAGQPAGQLKFSTESAATDPTVLRDLAMPPPPLESRPSPSPAGQGPAGRRPTLPTMAGLREAGHDAAAGLVGLVPLSLLDAVDRRWFWRAMAGTAAVLMVAVGFVALNRTGSGLETASATTVAIGSGSTTVDGGSPPIDGPSPLAPGAGGNPGSALFSSSSTSSTVAPATQARPAQARKAMAPRRKVKSTTVRRVPTSTTGSTDGTSISTSTSLPGDPTTSTTLPTTALPTTALPTTMPSIPTTTTATTTVRPTTTTATTGKPTTSTVETTSTTGSSSSTATTPTTPTTATTTGSTATTTTATTATTTASTPSISTSDATPTMP